MIKALGDIIHWKNKVVSMGVLLGFWAAVLSFQPFMITAGMIPLLIMGRIAPGLFIKHKVIGQVARSGYGVLRDTSDKYISVSNQCFFYSYYFYNNTSSIPLTTLTPNRFET